jgi:hypothetical protein
LLADIISSGAVQDTKINRFGIAALVAGNGFERNIINQRSRTLVEKV